MNNLKTARFSIAGRTDSGVHGPIPVDDNVASALDVFGAESALVESLPRHASPDPKVATAARIRGIAKWVGVVAVSAAATAAGMWAYSRRPLPVVPASLTLNTIPSGLDVIVGDRPAGRTPLTLTLPAGDHRIFVANATGQRREVAVSLKPGETVVQHLEMATPSPAPAAITGALTVETDPPKQSVMIDGVDRGWSPITVSSLSPGEHVVVIRGARGNLRRNVTVEPGKTVSLVISPVAAGESAGWLTVASPFVLQLKEHGKLIGTTETERLMIPAGDHEIEMTNDSLGYRTVQRVTVAAGKTTASRVQVPNGVLSINAVPWAEVWINGERIGETPIANVSRPIGVHEVILRHPQLGQRTASLTVSLKQTARLGIDMRKP